MMLDTGSTIQATIKNKDFLTNIRNSENPIVMATNAGMKRLATDGDMPGIGIAKYDPDQLANILGFSHMAEKQRITYDNEKEDAFFVHTKAGVKKFSRDGRLYTYQPSQDFINSIAEENSTTKIKNSDELESYYYLDCVMTLKGNRDGYTDRQYDRAKRAWKLYILSLIHI